MTLTTAHRRFEPRLLPAGTRQRIERPLAAVAAARARQWWGRGFARIGWVVVVALAGTAIWTVAARMAVVGAPLDQIFFSLLAVHLLVGVFWAFGRRPGWMAAARMLDERAASGDRLATALDLAREGRADAWARVQAAEAERFAAALDLVKLMPLRRPDGLVWLAVSASVALIALLWPLTALDSAASNAGGAAGLALALPPGHAGVVAASELLSADALELLRADMSLLSEVVDQLDDGATRKWLREVRSVLQDVEGGRIDRREALARLGELEAQRPAAPEKTAAEAAKAGAASESSSAVPTSRAEAGEAERDRDRAVKNAITKAAEATLDQAPPGAIREALKAAARTGDLGAIAKVLEKLVDKDMSDKELEKWVRFAEKMADKLGDQKIPKQFQELAERIRRLERKRSQEGGLSAGDQRRLQSTRRELDSLRRDHGDVQAAGRQLQRLERNAKQAADELRRAQGERSRLGRASGGGAEDEQRRQQQRSDLRKQMGKQMQRAADEMRREQHGQGERQAGRVGDAQVRKLREAIRQAGESGKGRERFERQARAGDASAAKDAQDNQERSDDPSKNQDGERGDAAAKPGDGSRESAERAARDRAAETEAERQRTGKRPGGKANQAANARQRRTDPSGKQGEARDAGDAKPGSGGQGKQASKFRLGQGELPDNDGMQRMADPSGTAKRGGGSGYGQGAGDDDIGRNGGAKAARTEHVKGKHGEGPSVKQVFVDAARRGFARTDWREVYADYADVADEMLEKERLPPGRKAMVRRYYELIRPRPTDRGAD